MGGGFCGFFGPLRVPWGKKFAIFFGGQEKKKKNHPGKKETQATPGEKTLAKRNFFGKREKNFPHEKIKGGKTCFWAPFL